MCVRYPAPPAESMAGVGEHKEPGPTWPPTRLGGVADHVLEHDSTYAKLLRIAPELLHELELPRVVMVGEESSGKSSTLERLVHMPFFPVDRQMCTRMPIELRLRRKTAAELAEFHERHALPESETGPGYVSVHVRRSPGSPLDDPSPPVIVSFDEAEATVSRLMRNVLTQIHGGPVGVSRDVLVLEVCNANVPNLDLVDLPGLVGGSVRGEPDDMMAQTRALSRDYLSDAHALACCVVSSRTERVRNSQALELVQGCGKADTCVGVLTMCDLAMDPRAPDDPHWHLKERLRGAADDLPQLACGYVGIARRRRRAPRAAPRLDARAPRRR